MSTSTRVERAILLAVLAVYGLLAVLYATQTPAWQVPDEPAHYNYTRQVAEAGCCPVLEPGDWDMAYLGELTGSAFAPDTLDALDTVQYEDHQPPLFYLLAAPLYRLSGGSLIALRLFSALLGAGVVLCVYGIARAASGGKAVIALGAAAAAAFVPQHIAIMAGAGNDSLAELIVGFGTLLTLWFLTPDMPRRVPLFGGETIERPMPVGALLALGVVMGLGFLTKASAFLLGPVVMLAILLRWWRGVRRPSDLLAAWALFLLPALVMGGLWWARNVGIYGWPDVMGLARHDAVVVGQPRTADWIVDRGLGVWLADGIATTFRSFWGQFGWMGVPMPGWVYRVLLLFTVVSYAGLLPLVGRLRRLSAGRRDSLLALAALYTLGILAFLYYNTAFVQFQGRYLYPAMSAFALAYAGGWAGWSALLAEHVPAGRWRAALRWLPVIVLGGLAGLSALALWRFLIPNLPAW